MNAVSGDSTRLTKIKENRGRKRRRFRRDTPLGFVMQERDWEMIRTVYEYQFITTKHLLTLFGTRKVYPRLEAMFHAGYLDRYKLSDNEATVHCVGIDAVEELAFRFGFDAECIRAQRRDNQKHKKNIRHTLLRSDIRVSLEQSVYKAGGELLWQNEARMEAVKSDAFTVLKRGEKVLYFAVEADRSTQGRQAWQEKIKKYDDIIELRRAKNEPMFRVLVVTISPRRVAWLREKTAQVARKRWLFLFSCVPWIQQGFFERVWQRYPDSEFVGLVD